MTTRRLATAALAAVATLVFATVGAACSSDTSTDLTMGSTTTADSANTTDSANTVTTTDAVDLATIDTTPPGLTDDRLIAIALGALRDAGITVGDDQEAVVRRGNSEADVGFPVRGDLPPIVGGEPHVVIEPVSGAVLEVVRTR